MAIYLVGENIDKARSYYQAETGKWKMLVIRDKLIEWAATHRNEVLLRPVFNNKIYK